MGRAIPNVTPGWDETEVYLNGIEIPFVSFADDEAGTVVCDVINVPDDAPHITLIGEEIISLDPTPIRIPTGPYQPRGNDPWWLCYTLANGPDGLGLTVRLRGTVVLRNGGSPS